MEKIKIPNVPVKSRSVKIDNDTEYTFGLSTIDETVCIGDEKYFIEKELPFSVLKKKIGKCKKCERKNSSSVLVLIIFLFILNSKCTPKKECDKCEDKDVEIKDCSCENQNEKRHHKHHKHCHTRTRLTVLN